MLPDIESYLPSSIFWKPRLIWRENRFGGGRPQRLSDFFLVVVRFISVTITGDEPSTHEVSEDRTLFFYRYRFRALTFHPSSLAGLT